MVSIPDGYCEKCRVPMNKIDQHMDPMFGEVVRYQCPKCKKETVEY